jgi:uncharacterized protein (TIGR02646 family)
MKYVKKGEEPKSFTDWKSQENEDWKPSWDNFQAPEKLEVHDSLLREQGYICCYCGMRIATANSNIKPNVDTSHIEHLKPRKHYPELALEYENLIASCQAERDKNPPPPIRCGHKKGDWYDEHLMVSPLDGNCQEFFAYSGSGEILPTDNPDKQAAKTTIEKLGLNIDKLIAMRREAIEGVLLAIDGLTEAEIQQLAQSYNQLDKQGRYTPFCAAIAYIFKQYFIA